MSNRKALEARLDEARVWNSIRVTALNFPKRARDEADKRIADLEAQLAALPAEPPAIPEPRDYEMEKLEAMVHERDYQIERLQKHLEIACAHRDAYKAHIDKFVEIQADALACKSPEPILIAAPAIPDYEAIVTAWDKSEEKGDLGELISRLNYVAEVLLEKQRSGQHRDPL